MVRRLVLLCKKLSFHLSAFQGETVNGRDQTDFIRQGKSSSRTLCLSWECVSMCQCEILWELESLSCWLRQILKGSFCGKSALYTDWNEELRTSTDHHHIVYRLRERALQSRDGWLCPKLRRATTCRHAAGWIGRAHCLHRRRFKPMVQGLAKIISTKLTPDASKPKRGMACLIQTCAKPKK